MKWARITQRLACLLLQLVLLPIGSHRRSFLIGWASGLQLFCSDETLEDRHRSRCLLLFLRMFLCYRIQNFRADSSTSPCFNLNEVYQQKKNFYCLRNNATCFVTGHRQIIRRKNPRIRKRSNSHSPKDSNISTSSLPDRRFSNQKRVSRCGLLCNEKNSRHEFYYRRPFAQI